MPELPPPLPPGIRTIGQLIAESIRAYGAHFLRALPLGIPYAVATQLELGRSFAAQAVALLALSPLIALAFVLACRLVLGGRVTVTAWLVAFLVFLPVPVFERLYVLPLSLAWLALVGMSVPAAVVEGLGFRAALARGRRLGTADYGHAVGSMFGLALVVVVSTLTLIVLLRTQGDNGQRAAHLLADVVLSPLLYIGGALLYRDQAARVGSTRSDRRRRRHAHLHPSLDPDAAGGADPQVEP
jgi:hypothetical protein